jgi:glutamate racemase
MARGCKSIVIACNTASAAALKELREAYPRYPFIGMEPAVKPAVERSRTGVVGVIATRATFQGELFASVVERYAQGTTVLEQPCPGLVQAIEAGELDTPGTERMLRAWLEPMVAKGMDELVLACTHYPLVRPLIERICGPGVEVIDPAPAVARQVRRVLEERGLLLAEAAGGLTVHTSAPHTGLPAVLAMLGLQADGTGQGTWSAGALTLP